MKKFFDIFKFKYLATPNTYNLYKSKTYDSQVIDYFNYYNKKSKISFYLFTKGLINLLFWGIIAVFMTIIYFFIIVFCGLYFRLFKNKKIEIEKNRNFYNLLNNLYHKPALFYLKLLESEFFTKFTIISPALDVGIENGEISSIYFKNQKIDVGGEYVPDNIKDAEHTKLYNNLVCFDLRNTCFKNNTFSTILMVHVIDHFSEFEKAFKEVWRILKPGGYCAFSALDKNFWQADPLLNILKKLKINKIAIKYEFYSKKRRPLYNDYFLNEYKDKLKNLGFEIIQAKTFLKGRIKHLWGFFFFYFECLGAAGIFEILKKNKLMPKFIEKILKWSIINIFYNCYLKEQTESEEGGHVFLIIKKAGELANFEPYKNQDFNLYQNLICPTCYSDLSYLDQKLYLQCKSCFKKYHFFYNNIPVLLSK